MPNEEIKINVSFDSLRQIPQYKAAFDSLRDAVNNLNKTVQASTDNLTRFNAQNKETVNWGSRVNKTVKDLTGTFETGQKLLKMFEEGFKNWAGGLSLAFTLITTYGPQVLDFLSNMFKSDKAKEAAEALRNYNEVMQAYIQNVSGEISQLGMLVSIVNNKNLAEQTRMNALKQLNELSPKYLANLTRENIGTKEGKQMLDEYTKSLKNKAMEEETQAKRSEYVQKRLELKNRYDAAVNERKEYLTGKKEEFEGYQTTPTGPGMGGVYVVVNRKDQAKQMVTDIANEDKKLLKQIAHLDNELAKSLNKNAPAVNTIRNKGYWETELANQQAALARLDAASKDFEAKSKPVIARIKSINKTLNLYAINDGAISVSTKHIEPEENFRQYERIAGLALQKQLLATTNAFNKQVSVTHGNYVAEQQALKNQYDQKLITQEEYHTQSEQLEEKYHVSIGETLQHMNERDLERMQQQQQALIDAQKQNELITDDENNINQAILPGDKLAAEKQLITDKYNFEIQKAAEAGQDTLAIRQQYEEEITALTQQYEQQRKEFALQVAQDVSNQAFAIIGNNIRAQTDAKIKGLEEDKALEMSNKSLSNSQRQAIEQKYKQKENQLKVKAFKDEQKLSLGQAIVNGALAITKATSQVGILAPFVIPGIIAATAIQIGTILAQKPPAFAKGGRFVSDGRGAVLPGYSTVDNTNAQLRSGEAVVVSEAMRNPWARNLVSAINVAHGGRDFSVANPGNGYAVGGIFTDGGNAGRYYSQPVNDVKDLANTLAYQMINNFPPIYVDVKDVNNQQGILAKTTERVNL